jgi:Amidohydrolase
MTAQTKIIDFHNHHIPARFELTATRTQPATQRARWEMLARKLPDEDLLLRDIREGHLAARVVNIPGNLIADENGHVPHQTIKAINDNLAELAARHPGRIYGLASVDGYDGDRSAREAERAITELGLRGLFVDCARGDLLIDAPQARPTLEVAAKFGVPVFAHPIAPEPLTKQMTPYGPHRYAVRAWCREWGIPHRSGRRRGILRIAGPASRRDRTCHRRIGNGYGPVAAEQTPHWHHRGDAQACLHRHDIDTSRSDPRLCRCAGG